jgi:hypothetical protein
MSDTVDFKGQCGECTSGYYSASTSGGGMQPDQSATVNGQAPQNCVIANDGATVFKIEVLNNAGFYKYQVRVDAQGPSGPFSGSMYLAFRDMTDDVYYLSVFSSRRESHTVSYNSDAPAIKTVYWSDKSFHVTDSNKPKAQFMVTSPSGPSQ